MTVQSPAFKDPLFITSTEVKTALGLTPYDKADDAWLDLTVAAVNWYVVETRWDLARVSSGPFDPTAYNRADWTTRWSSIVWVMNPRVHLGAVMLATRWYKRRGAQDVAAFSEFGGPPPTIDKDIETLLGVGRAYRPVVA